MQMNWGVIAKTRLCAIGSKSVELTIRTEFANEECTGGASDGSDLPGFLGPVQLGVAPVNKSFDCFLPNASGVSYFKLECGRTVL